MLAFFQTFEIYKRMYIFATGLFITYKFNPVTWHLSSCTHYAFKRKIITTKNVIFTLIRYHAYNEKIRHVYNDHLHDTEIYLIPVSK